MVDIFGVDSGGVVSGREGEWEKRREKMSLEQGEEWRILACSEELESRFGRVV